jgi:SAM-dependent methyltransferase
MLGLERTRSICVCPACHSSLAWSADGGSCTGCATAYRLESGIPILLPPHEPALASPVERHATAPFGLRSISRRILRLEPRYTYKSPRTRFLSKAFASSFPPGALVLNVGSGATDYGAAILNLDVAPGAGVDVVALAERLPLADSSCDGIVLEAVLEHVSDADTTLAEARRVLTPGGRVYVDVPFMQGYHEAPDDYRRFTRSGLHSELRRHRFEIEDGGVSVGPGSALAWVASEYLALLVSWRSSQAFLHARKLTPFLVGWIRRTDRWLDRHPDSHVIASGVWAIGRKSSADMAQDRLGTRASG